MSVDRGDLTTHPFVQELLVRCRFPAVEVPLVCAVSGGADSLALLVLARAHGNAATAVHVDHGLRIASATEAVAVRRVAESVGAGFESVRVTVGSGGNVEARARTARYDVLPEDVCTGHTADDQAETVLINMLRGSGLDGLAALSGAGLRRRPILQLRRSDTRRLCEQLGLAVLDDPMNHDPQFLRVRVRNEVLPLLCEVARRDVVPVLARQAAIAADDLDVLRRAAALLDPADARMLHDAPPALARRAVRAWLQAGGVTGDHPPSLAVVERVRDVASGRVPRADLVSRWRVERRAQRLRLVHLPHDPDQPV